MFVRRIAVDVCKLYVHNLQKLCLQRWMCVQIQKILRIALTITQLILPGYERISEWATRCLSIKNI